MLNPHLADQLAKVVTRENVNHIPQDVKLDTGDNLFFGYRYVGSSFLAYVVHLGNMVALEWLLSTFKGHIDFSITTLSHGSTPLEYAIFHWPQAVRLLIEAGAPPKHCFDLILRNAKHYNHLHQDAAESFFKVGAVDLDRDYGELLPDWLIAMLWRYREYRRRSREAALILLGIQRFRKPLVVERFLAREIAQMVWATRCDNKWGRVLFRVRL